MSDPARVQQRFSSDAEEELASALERYVATWPDARHESVHAALVRLSAETHSRRLGPEAMLVTVRATWSASSHGKRLDPEAKRIAFARVIRYCLDAYYRQDD